MALTRIDYDCAAGEHRIIPLTPEEEAVHLATAAMIAAEQRAVETKRAAAIAAIKTKAATDPVFAALAHLLGVS